MKKTTIIIVFLLFPLITYGDVIFIPYQYSLFSYSAELVYSYEKVTGPYKTNVFWAGAGTVCSFLYLDEPKYGLELALERRHYFKSDEYRHFFFSVYLGTALMTDRDFREKDLGIVPGIKINYKSQQYRKLVLEPYISLSLPVSFNVDQWNDWNMYVPFPLATIGIRLGICNLKRNE